MRRQAGNQVGQHGGTNRGLGGGEGERRGTFTLGNHPHQGGGRMSQGKRDTWGLKESSLVVFARFPQLSALEIPGWGHEVAYEDYFQFREFNTQSTGNPWQHFISGADRKGKVSLQGLSFERCRQTSRSLRGLTDPRHLDALLLFMTAVPSNTDAPHIPKHPFAPPEWVTSCGCLWGCVRALYR